MMVLRPIARTSAGGDVPSRFTIESTGSKRGDGVEELDGSASMPIAERAACERLADLPVCVSDVVSKACSAMRTDSHTVRSSLNGFESFLRYPRQGFRSQTSEHQHSVQLSDESTSRCHETFCNCRPHEPDMIQSLKTKLG